MRTMPAATRQCWEEEGREGGREETRIQERRAETKGGKGERDKRERGGSVDVAVAVGRGVSYLARAALPKHPWVAVWGATTTPRAASTRTRTALEVTCEAYPRRLVPTSLAFLGGRASSPLSACSPGWRSSSLPLNPSRGQTRSPSSPRSGPRSDKCRLVRPLLY